jgi:hypothetical protein
MQLRCMSARPEDRFNSVHTTYPHLMLAKNIHWEIPAGVKASALVI